MPQCSAVRRITLSSLRASVHVQSVKLHYVASSTGLCFVGRGGGGLASPGRPTHPHQKTFPPAKNEFIKGAGKLRPILSTQTLFWPRTPCVTFRLVVAPLRGPGRSPVLPFACCVGSLRSVGRCGRCSCWCRGLGVSFSLSKSLSRSSTRPRSVTMAQLGPRRKS